MHSFLYRPFNFTVHFTINSISKGSSWGQFSLNLWPTKMLITQQKNISLQINRKCCKSFKTSKTLFWRFLLSHIWINKQMKWKKTDWVAFMSKPSWVEMPLKLWLKMLLKLSWLLFEVRNFIWPCSTLFYSAFFQLDGL